MKQFIHILIGLSISYVASLFINIHVYDSYRKYQMFILIFVHVVCSQQIPDTVEHCNKWFAHVWFYISRRCIHVYVHYTFGTIKQVVVKLYVVRCQVAEKCNTAYAVPFSLENCGLNISVARLFKNNVHSFSNFFTPPSNAIFTYLNSGMSNFGKPLLLIEDVTYEQHQ